MCERAFVGCPHCSEPADSGSLVQRELATELIRYTLDDDGEVDRNAEPDYQGNVDVTDDGYECQACGWSGSSLDEDCTTEDCDCDDCVEPDPEDAGADPDRIVVLRRTCDQPFDVEKIFGEAIPEFSKLWADRATYFLPLPRWRAAELYREYLTDAVGAERTGIPIVIDFSFTMPDEDAYELILPGFDPHKSNYKGAPDDGHVAACV
jgi:hypothetical protein